MVAKGKKKKSSPNCPFSKMRAGFQNSEFCSCPCDLQSSCFLALTFPGLSQLWLFLWNIWSVFSWNTSQVGFHSPLPPGHSHSSPFPASSSSTSSEGSDPQDSMHSSSLFPLLSSHSLHDFKNDLYAIIWHHILHNQSKTHVNGSLLLIFLLFHLMRFRSVLELACSVLFSTFTRMSYSSLKVYVFKTVFS